jgi:membrane protease YdiL (CAAX protease family)
VSEPTTPDTNPRGSHEPALVTRLVSSYPEAPLVVPFMSFLVLMLLDGVFPESLRAVSYGIRTLACLWIVWVFRRHLPPLGRPLLYLSIPAGIFVAWMWVEVHHFLTGCTGDPCRALGLLGITHHFAGFDAYRDYMMFDGDASKYFVPAEKFSSPWGLWSFLVIRIGGAAVTVPIVEELFWRGFMLRLLIDWHRFEDVPLGKFTWFSFLVTSALSAVQHPGQWEVGILCWVIYNGLFYWTRSLTCLMVTHGVTNLVLYTYVYHAQDWRFW